MTCVLTGIRFDWLAIPRRRATTDADKSTPASCVTDGSKLIEQAGAGALTVSQADVNKIIDDCT